MTLLKTHYNHEYHLWMTCIYYGGSGVQYSERNIVDEDKHYRTNIMKCLADQHGSGDLAHVPA